MILSLPVLSIAFVTLRPRNGGRVIALAGILCAVLPFPAAGVGLGAVTQQSALGQTLRIVVPVTLGPGEDVSAECFKLAAAERDGDGVPQLLFGRVNVERSSSGTTLVVTSPRPVNEPVVRLTLQAGCEAAVRREYTLFMELPAIEAPIVAGALTPREALGLPPRVSVPREPRRAAPSQPRAVTGAAARSAPAPSSASAAGSGTARNAAPPRSAQRRSPRRDPRPPWRPTGRDFRCRVGLPPRSPVRPRKQTAKGRVRNERMRSKPRRKSFVNASWN